MGNRSIFRYRSWYHGMTREVKPGRATVVPVEAASYSRRGKRREASGDSEPTHGKAKRA